MNHLRRAFVIVLLLCSARFAIAGGAADVTLRTDHPQYAGEGAFQTVGDCVRFATDGKSTDQDKAIALYLWKLTHQWHLASPQEWNVPGEVPDTTKWRDEMIVYDANRARFSYGYGLCGTVHSWNEPYWRALGMKARRRAFPGHVNSEVRYGDSWHAFDTDMAGLVFRKDGKVAGYDDIIGDPALVKQTRAPIPCYPFAWPSDFNSMRKGWQQVASGKKWYRLYNGGYATQPAIVTLRRGETFTRWFDPDHYGGKQKRRFWHNQAGGPFRDWTFANRGQPQHRGAESNSRGNASYCNGEFTYRPELSSESCREGVIDESTNVVYSASSPLLKSSDGEPAHVTFEHFSPYVICGDPVDDANPMSGKATEGFVLTGRAVGAANLEVSNDQGQSWHDVGTVDGEFSRDLTEWVKGRYGWQVRLQFAASAGFDALEFTTITQVSQAIYPRLTSGGCRVNYRCGSRAVTPVLPNFGLSEEKVQSIEVRKLRSPNVAYQPRSAKGRLAYRTTNNKPGHVVFRIDTGKHPLQSVHAAACYQVRVPPPQNCDFRIDLSTDDGNSWRPLAKADIATDNEFSKGWMYGTANVPKASIRDALVRITFYQGGYTTGLLAVQVYGVHRRPHAGETVVTYGWQEDGRTKTHTERIAKAAVSHAFDIPTGKDVRDDFVRIEAR